MKNEFTPKPGWLADDIARAQGVYRPADEIAKSLGCPRDPRFGCSECGADWIDACRRTIGVTQMVLVPIHPTPAMRDALREAMQMTPKREGWTFRVERWWQAMLGAVGK